VRRVETLADKGLIAFAIYWHMPIDFMPTTPYTPGLEFLFTQFGVDDSRRRHVKRTYQPSKLVRARRHGYRARRATVGGRRVLSNRRAKGRKSLSA